MVSVLGPTDELLRTMERAFPKTEILVRGNEFRLRGPADDLEVIDRLLDEIMEIVEAGHPLNKDAVERAITMLRGQTRERPADVLTMNIVSNRGRTIRPKTLGQKHYVDAIGDNTVIFGIGPAGTGKTYLAMAKAVAACRPSRSRGSSSPDRPSRRGRSSASCPARSATRSTRTCDRSTTRCTT